MRLRQSAFVVALVAITAAPVFAPAACVACRLRPRRSRLKNDPPPDPDRVRGMTRRSRLD